MLICKHTKERKKMFMNLTETQRTLEELKKLVKTQDLELKVLNFYGSNNFFFACEDGKVAEVGYEG